jgi:hypothetical protein
LVSIREDLEIRALRGIFGPKRDEIIRGRKLQNEELSNFYSSSNIIRMIKSRRIRWAWHVARSWLGTEMHAGFGWKAKRKRPLGKGKVVPVLNYE